MFVYQKKDGGVCFTSKDNKPVEQPGLVIEPSEDAEKDIAVSLDGASVEGGAGEVFEVVVTPDGENPLKGTSDKTVGEIYEAYMSGKPVRIYAPSSADVMVIFSISNISVRGNEYACQAMGIQNPDGIMGVMDMYWQTAEGNEWNLSYFQLTPYTPQ